MITLKFCYYDNSMSRYLGFHDIVCQLICNVSIIALILIGYVAYFILIIETEKDMFSVLNLVKETRFP